MTKKFFKKLNSLATVRTGLVLARKSTEDETPYRYRLLTLRAVEEGGVINETFLENYFATEKLHQDYVTQVGDVIVRLTMPYTAVLIDETTEKLVFSSNFALIRTRREELLPEFLLCALNSQHARKQVYRNATRNILGTIQAQCLSELEIVLPPIEEQRKIAKFNALAQREIRLLRQLITAKEQLRTQLLETMYNQFQD